MHSFCADQISKIYCDFQNSTSLSSGGLGAIISLGLFPTLQIFEGPLSYASHVQLVKKGPTRSLPYGQVHHWIIIVKKF